MKLGIFGGTFNPIHYGHLRAAEEARERLNLDKILFVPSGNPPLKIEGLTDAKHRYEMVRLAVAQNHFFDISDIECRRPEKSYSVDTLGELKGIYPDIAFFFILGIDSFLDIPNWWQPERLIELTNFVVISRPSFNFFDLLSSPYLSIDKSILKKLDDGVMDLYTTKLSSGKAVSFLRLTPIGISATEIRSFVREGKSIKYLLPAVVESYIISNKLYKT